MGFAYFFLGLGESGDQVLRATDVELTLMEQKCNSLAFSETATSYCYEKYETKKDRQYINCKYAEEEFGITIEDDEIVELLNYLLISNLIESKT